MTPSLRLLRFWRSYAERYRHIYLAGLFCLLLTNVLTVAIPGFVQRVVDALAEGRPSSDALVWVWAILASGLAVIVVRTLSRVLFFNPGRTIEFRLKNDLFEHLLELPRVFFDKMRAGEIISRGTNDVSSVRGLIGYAGLQLFNVALTLSLTLGKMLWVDQSLTLLCAVPLFFAAVFLRHAISRMFRLTFELLRQLAVLSDSVLEMYNGVGVLAPMGAISGAHARFDEQNAELLRITLALASVRSWMLPVVSLVGNLCVVLLLYVGGRRVVEGTFSIGELAAFAVYVNILVAGLTSVGWMVNAVQRGYAGLCRVDELLDAPVGRLASLLRPKPSTRGHSLTVRNLDFAYPDAPDSRVLSGVDFTLEAGEKVGIFGLTGSGKSTLLKVLARIYDPPAGTVRLDGVDIVDLEIRDFWRGIAFVPQEPFLFSQTVRENIALGRPMGAEIDEARVAAAVEDASLTDDLVELADGLDTRVGERGITLSGGQRQRAALARTFYRDFKLLLLDDVMSAVDHNTEHRLIDAIYRRGESVTTMIVSHRVSALARADRILVLDRGRVVDEGDHDALIAKGSGPYHSAWRLQQAVEELETRSGS